jgi:hypothetical protein
MQQEEEGGHKTRRRRRTNETRGARTAASGSALLMGTEMESLHLTPLRLQLRSVLCPRDGR